MSFYRTKSVVVQASQWFPPGDPRHDPSMLSHRKGNTSDPPDYRQTGDIYAFAEGMSPGMGGDIYSIRVGGPNDNINLEPGDWIITSHGRKSVCKADAFEQAYEPSEPSP